MWRSLWRSIDRFSLHHFKHVIDELREIKVVNKHNKELVVDLLQSIVEIVAYGDSQDPMIFECFMENQVLAEFVRVLKISKKSRIEAPLLQYLSIMIQNMDSEHAIYYCFSNDHINSIVSHQYEFNEGDLTSYYVSFLRAVSSKLNRDTLCLLIKVHGDTVVSFPLYDEALRFACHGEKMVQTAIRALTLCIYNVSDDMVYQYIMTPPASKYFSNLVLSLKEQCFHLDTLVRAAMETCNHQKRKELLLETDKIIDDLYYFKDILSVGEPRLCKLVTGNLLSLLVLPILLPLLRSTHASDPDLSPATSLYLISLLLQVIGGRGLFNTVAGVILYTYVTSNIRDSIQEMIAQELTPTNYLFKHLSEVKTRTCPAPAYEKEEKTSSSEDIYNERTGILSYFLSENHSVQLASLYLVLIIAESKDLDYLFSPIIGLNRDNGTTIPNENILIKFMDKTLKALLKVLASQAPLCIEIQLHTGWLLQKLLIFKGKRCDGHTRQLFNTSYECALECLKKELDACWFDHIPDTLRNEWPNCKKALEESVQDKDPFFALEITVGQQTASGDSTHCAWQRMVDTVKVFVLNVQLKGYIFSGEFLECPLNMTQSLAADSGRTHASDISVASFGSEVSLGTGVPCRISFSNAEVRDIYMIVVAKGSSGKLFLTEKHPFRSQRGVVLAIAPLAGLSPKIDDAHPTWLHLTIREFDPKFGVNNLKGQQSKMQNQMVRGRWTLGFPTAKACDSARLSILEETRKQRSNVEHALAPLLHSSGCFEKLLEVQDA